MKMVMEQSKNPTNNVPAGFGTQNIAGVTDEDQMINEALMASISQNQQNIHSNSYEPLNPEQRKRETDVPCGLKNIGNTCYFNSILQVYYNIPEFVNAILDFQDDNAPLPSLSKEKPQSQDANPQDQGPSIEDQEEQQAIKRLESSRKLIKQLQIIFG